MNTKKDKDARTTLGVFIVKFEYISHLFSSASIVAFGQVIVR